MVLVLVNASIKLVAEVQVVLQLDVLLVSISRLTLPNYLQSFLDSVKKCLGDGHARLVSLLLNSLQAYLVESESTHVDESVIEVEELQLKNSLW